MELYNVLVQVRFATSKMEDGIYYNKLGIQDPEQVVEQLKTKDHRQLNNNNTYSNNM